MARKLPLSVRGSPETQKREQALTTEKQGGVYTASDRAAHTVQTHSVLGLLILDAGYAGCAGSSAHVPHARLSDLLRLHKHPIHSTPALIRGQVLAPMGRVRRSTARPRCVSLPCGTAR